MTAKPEKPSEEVKVPRAWEAPDRGAFVDAHLDKTLREYRASVLQWHGYIRFVSLPHLRENPDVEIDRLFVEPLLATRHIGPDVPPEDWKETEPAQQALETHPRLVVLGDPGSGKSTLISWLSWRLARRTDEPWSAELDGLVPLPMILRELTIPRGITWDGLIAAFLGHLMCQDKLDLPAVERLLTSGQALIMLDGLDEIGSVEVRKSLRDAVFEGMDRYPKCRWLLSSRVVGYYTVAFDSFAMSLLASKHKPSPEPISRVLVKRLKSVGELLYAAPFNDDQISQFARNWFMEREAVREKAYQDATSFVQAIRANRNTQRLARTPNLLTMMALIYRIRARLPNGRALLYADIVQAYLHSIDEYRKLQDLDYPLEQKRSWLARVGFEMQLRRSAAAKEQAQVEDAARPGPKDDSQREILATAADLKNWIAEAMNESASGGDERTAEQFVDYIGRRSGLLLPRGQDQFAFMHLSFQEYFAAYFLLEEITAARNARTEAVPGARDEDLRGYAKEIAWRETLIFLFELGAHQKLWSKALAQTIWGDQFQNLMNPEWREESQRSAVLLAVLAADPHSGFDRDTRRRASEEATRWQLEYTRRRRTGKPRRLEIYSNFVLASLMTSESFESRDVWDGIQAAVIASSEPHLDLRGTGIKDLGPLARLPHLQFLDLDRTAVWDLGPLAGLTQLRKLGLNQTSVSDLGPLAGLTQLEWLDLDQTSVSDLGPLAELAQLQRLDIDRTLVSDLGSLAGLAKLHWISLEQTSVSDLGPLTGLAQLESLYCDGTNVSGSNIKQFQAARRKARLQEVDLSN